MKLSSWIHWGPQRRSKPRALPRLAGQQASAPEPVSVDYSAVQAPLGELAAAIGTASEAAFHYPATRTSHEAGRDIGNALSRGFDSLTLSPSLPVPQPAPGLHYRGSTTTTGPRAACGKWVAADAITETPAHVGCGGCKRTRTYRNATAP